MVWAGFWTIGFGVVVVEGGGLFKASKQFVGAGVSSPQHHTCRFAASQIWLLKFVNKVRKYGWLFGSTVSCSTSLLLHEHVEKAWQLQDRVRHESPAPLTDAEKKKKS